MVCGYRYKESDPQVCMPILFVHIYEGELTTELRSIKCGGSVFSFRHIYVHKFIMSQQVALALSLEHWGTDWWGQPTGSTCPLFRAHRGRLMGWPFTPHFKWFYVHIYAHTYIMNHQVGRALSVAHKGADWWADHSPLNSSDFARSVWRVPQVAGTAMSKNISS